MRSKVMMWVIGVVVAGLFAITLSGCGSSDEETGGLDDSTPQAPANTQEAGGSEQGGGGDSNDYVIIMQDFSFEPTNLEIDSGAVQLEFDNQGNATHNWTAYKNSDYTESVHSTGDVNGGVNYTMNESWDPGEYYFRCENHNQMQGTLTVKQAE